jgi:tRNA-splicing ligase RtcB
MSIKTKFNVITTEANPIYCWADDVEESALVQARNLANLPFVFKRVCLMPDTHAGIGMPIGGVLPTKGVVIPNAVGVDIGCGMCATKTNIQVNTLSKGEIKGIMADVRKVIPLGFDHHKEIQDEEFMPNMYIDNLKIVKENYKVARQSVGTLGGGNHFIEFQKDEEGYLWVMIHSGSRNLGLQVASHYDKLAKELNELYYSKVETGTKLSFLPIGTKEAKDYILEMKYCIQFALCNRNLMMSRILDIIQNKYPDTKLDPMINIPHNYVAGEEHYGETVFVHRKGATSAKLGEVGIIPGSQGTSSYITEGLGNPMSFNSCSHGAGRVLGRKAAIRDLDLETEKKKLDDLGIIHSIRNKSDLDEASSAYKDIDKVMSSQSDLVKILVKLSPLAVIKG